MEEKIKELNSLFNRNQRLSELVGELRQIVDEIKFLTSFTGSMFKWNVERIDRRLDVLHERYNLKSEEFERIKNENKNGTRNN